MNYVRKQFRDHAEYVSCVGVDGKRAEFTGNKQTYRHSALYTSTEVPSAADTSGTKHYR